MKQLLQTRSAEAVHQLVRIYTKPNMRRAKRILYPSLKLLLKKRAKPVIGLNFYLELII